MRRACAPSAIRTRHSVASATRRLVAPSTRKISSSPHGFLQKAPRLAVSCLGISRNRALISLPRAHFAKWWPSTTPSKRDESKDVERDEEREDDSDDRIPVEMDPAVREAAMELKKAQTDEEKLAALQKLLRFADELDDLPDMLDELQVPEVLEEMLESENTILQRHAYMLLFDVEYSMEIMDFNREHFMQWIEEMAEYQTKITDPFLLCVHSALKNLLMEDIDLRDTDAEAGVEVDEDLYEGFVQELIETLPVDMKTKLLERLHDLTKPSTDWTDDEAAIWDITTFAEKIGLVNFVGIVLGTKTTIPEMREDDDDTE